MPFQSIEAPGGCGHSFIQINIDKVVINLNLHLRCPGPIHYPHKLFFYYFRLFKSNSTLHTVYITYTLSGIHLSSMHKNCWCKLLLYYVLLYYYVTITYYYHYLYLLFSQVRQNSRASNHFSLSLFNEVPIQFT